MRLPLALACLCLPLAACGLDAKTDAAQDVRALLVAAETGDAQAFEDGIDREKLKSDLKVQLRETARAQGIPVDGPSEAALERMIGPQALSIVRTGGAEPPSEAQIASALKIQDGRLACLRASEDAEGCALTFEKQDDRWRLVGLQTGRLELKPGEATSARP